MSLGVLLKLVILNTFVTIVFLVSHVRAVLAQPVTNSPSSVQVTPPNSSAIFSEQRYSAVRTAVGIGKNSWTDDNAPTALVPKNTSSTTLSERPVIFIYIPTEVTGLRARFRVRNENGDLIYTSDFNLPTSAGIWELQTSPESPQLDINKLYQWELILILDPKQPAINPRLAGWVKRLETDSRFKQQLQASKPEEHPTLYAEAKIWQESLISLAKLRRTALENEQLQQQWGTLLQSVDLQTIRLQPLKGSLVLPNSEARSPQVQPNIRLTPGAPGISEASEPTSQKPGGGGSSRTNIRPRPPGRKPGGGPN